MRSAVVALALALAPLSGCSGTHHRDARPGDASARPAVGAADGAAAAAAAPEPGPPVVTPVELPGGDGGIGFDDLQYAASVGVIVPAGRTGALDLVDPGTGAVAQVTGFSADEVYGGGHGEGTTSAVVGGGWLLAIDRTAMRLDVVDPATRAIVAHAALAASPDYVRWIDATGEAWVTEPDGEQIEVFRIAADGAASRGATVHVAGGPESLVVSPRRGVAYAHLWHGKTVAIDVASRRVTATWANGCTGSRGIALDEARGWLFVGCAEGQVTVLDVDHDATTLGHADTDAGVDIIAYAPALHRIYAPASKTGTLAVLAVGDGGELATVATVALAKGSHCATTDGAGRVWACDPDHGRLLAVTGLP